MMTIETLREKARKHPVATFVMGLLACATVGMGGVFWGFDIADSGFYLTFYDNFYNAPGTVSYNFMYYMSGLLGGALQAAFPAMGMAGMRLAGLALCLLAMTALFVATRCGRSTVSALDVSVGGLLVTLAFLPPLYTLSYDLFTVFFYCLAILCLVKGCERESRLWMVAAGMMLALNMFSRVPNVLSLLLVAAVVVDARHEHRPWRVAAARVAWVLAGFMLMVAVTLIVMKQLGHRELMLENIADLRAIAADDSGTASHTTGQLITTQLRFYGNLLWCAAKLGVCVLLLDYALAWSNRKTMRAVLAVAALALWCYFTYRMRALEPLWLMVAVACVDTMRRGDRTMAALALMGLTMLVVMPLGSDGAYNNGAVIAWGAVPILGSWWLATRRRRLLLGTFLLVCLCRLVVGGSYFDAGALTAKTATIHNDRAAHILTTPARAAIVNDMLDGISPYIHEGDTLLAYGSIPTVNYLTRTRPFMGCSWPEQLSATMMEKKLAEGFETKPAVLRQKFNTLGDVWSQPSDSYLADYGTQSSYQDNAKLDVLNRFLLLGGYRTVWENRYFVLYKSDY